MHDIVQAVSDFVSNVGFPIAAFVLMWWSNRETMRNHKEEMDSITEAVGALRASIDKLSDRL